MGRTVFRGYNRVKFQSEKLGKTVFCQSLLLRDYLLHLEWDETVQSYELKPFKISIKIDGNRKIIKPHLLLNHSDKQPTITWLKSATDDDSNHERTIKSLSTYLETKGLDFSVKNAAEIRREPLFSNLKFLRRYIRCEISFRDSLLCNEFFEYISEPHLGDLISFFKGKNAHVQNAFALLSHKIIEADIYTNQINYELPIKLRQQFPNFTNGRLTI